MHWIIAAGAAIGAAAGWRFVIAPLRRAWREAMAVLRAIRDASGGVQALSRELHVLAGAFVNFAMHNNDEINNLAKSLADLTQRHKDLADLYVDLAADVTRALRRTDRRSNPR
jgi:ABC-type transporter Mla subunit MlaD